MALRLLAVLTILGLAACNEPVPGARQQSPSETALTQSARALQRTVYQGTAIGAGTGATLDFVLGGDGEEGGRTGATVGLGAGSYVAFLQRRFRNRERRLERIAEDLDRTNAEAEAALQASRAVLAEQQAQIAALRAQIAAGQGASRALEAELDDIQANVGEVERAIDGAERRRADFGEARGLVLAEQAVTEIDPRAAALQRRIDAMREVAEAMAAL